jgi:hypothetical protein
MTQDLRGHTKPPNLPTEFHRMCTRCGRRTAKVKFSLRVGANICQPNCPKTN